MSVATKPTLTPAQRVAAHRRAAQIRTGAVSVPLACPTCYSPSIQRSTPPDEPGLRCEKCGRTAKSELVKKIRQQRLRRFLLDGAL